MTIALRGSMPIKVYSVYAPTAQAGAKTKQCFYTMLTKETRTDTNKHIVYVMGDFNARIQTCRRGEEDIVGPHTLDKNNTNLHVQKEEVLCNRQALIKYAMETKQIIAITWFCKPEHKKVTFR